MKSAAWSRQNRRRLGAAVATIVLIAGLLVVALIFVNDDSDSGAGGGDAATSSGATDSDTNADDGAGGGDANLASYCRTAAALRSRIPGEPDPAEFLLALRESWTVRSERGEAADPNDPPDAVADETEIVQSALDESVASDTTAPLEAPETIEAASVISDFQGQNCN